MSMGIHVPQGRPDFLQARAECIEQTNKQFFGHGH